jgi:hypothetical protein
MFCGMCLLSGDEIGLILHSMSQSERYLLMLHEASMQTVIVGGSVCESLCLSLAKYVGNEWDIL